MLRAREVRKAGRAVATASKQYRQTLRYGCIVLSSPEDEAALLGARVNSLIMDDLEAYYELVFGSEPRRLAPPEYRTARP